MPISAKSSTQVNDGKIGDFMRASRQVLEGLKQKIANPDSGVIGYGTSRQVKKLSADSSTVAYNVSYEDAQYKTIVIFKDYESLGEFRGTHKAISKAPELLKGEMFSKEHIDLEGPAAIKGYMEHYLCGGGDFQVDNLHIIGEIPEQSVS